MRYFLIVFFFTNRLFFSLLAIAYLEVISRENLSFFTQPSGGNWLFYMRSWFWFRPAVFQGEDICRDAAVLSLFRLKNCGWVDGWVEFGCSCLARVITIGCSTIFMVTTERPDFMTRTAHNVQTWPERRLSFLGQFLWVPKPAISLPNRGISLPKLQIILGS